MGDRNSERQFTLEEERERFDAMLPELLQEHAGEFALVKRGEMLGLFASADEAYSAGLSQFGPDGVFLVAEIEPSRTEVTSIAWSSGVMVG